MCLGISPHFLLAPWLATTQHISTVTLGSSWSTIDVLSPHAYNSLTNTMSLSDDIPCVLCLREDTCRAMVRISRAPKAVCQATDTHAVSMPPPLGSCSGSPAIPPAAIFCCQTKRAFLPALSAPTSPAIEATATANR